MNGLLDKNPLAPVTANRMMLAQALRARNKPEFQMKQPTLQGVLDNAALATSPVPLLGDVVGLGADANRFINEPESRTPLNFGLAALGLIPFLPPMLSAGLGKLSGGAIPKPKGVPSSQMGAIVWHGSPHTFPPTKNNPLGEFDPTKIGTGEGAQAYGHGHYLGGARKTGQFYRDTLSGYEQPFLKIGNERRAGQELTDADMKILGYLESGKRMAGQFPHNTEYYAAQIAEKAGDTAAAELIKKNKWNTQTGYEKVKGSLYKVDLPDEAIAKMLDWDKPLSQQSKEVQDAFLKMVPKPGTNRYFDDLLLATPSKQGGLEYKAPISRFYHGIGSGSHADLSQKLHQQGIPGIRYLDGMSRGSGDGTRNFVVFPGNEGLLKILSRE